MSRPGTRRPEPQLYSRIDSDYRKKAGDFTSHVRVAPDRVGTSEQMPKIPLAFSTSKFPSGQFPVGNCPSKLAKWGTIRARSGASSLAACWLAASIPRIISPNAPGGFPPGRTMPHFEVGKYRVKMSEVGGKRKKGFKWGIVGNKWGVVPSQFASGESIFYSITYMYEYHVFWSTVL